MKRFLLSAMFLAVLMGCSNQGDDLEPIDLEGRWIEIESKTDTLSFEQLGEQSVLRLARGKELQDGFLKPKYRSGLYNYELSDKKIALRWLLSSNSEFEEYPLTIKRSRLHIGNFYASPSGQVLIFEKME